MAVPDAECLADVLNAVGSIDAALARYHERRHCFGTRVISRAWLDGEHLGAQATKPWETWAAREARSEPLGMMQEGNAWLRDIPELV